MAGFSNYFAEALKTYSVSGTALPTIATYYVALWNGDPTDAGSGGTEVTGASGLTRQAVTWTSGGTGIVQNSTDLLFGVATTSISATHVAVWDASSGGNMIYSGALDSALNAVTDQVVRILAGELEIPFQ